MKFSFFPCVVLLLATAALAKEAPKPKPCPKGQVATTEKATGRQVCFEMTLPPMQPMTVEVAKPVPRKP